MQAIIAKSPKLNNTDLKQQAAEPLNAYLRNDPWTDQVIKLNAAAEPSSAPATSCPSRSPPSLSTSPTGSPPSIPTQPPAARPLQQLPQLNPSPNPTAAFQSGLGN